MSHPPHGRQNSRGNSQKRPASIAELAERAMVDLWDDTKDFKYYLRLAEKYRKEGKECAKRGDLEGAFVELARAATLVLEKLPMHKDYYSVLNSNQRQNLGLNGQDILDNLGELKPTLVDRYDKWFQKHQQEGGEHERTPNARTQKIEADERAQREADERRQREQQQLNSREHREMEDELFRWRQQRAEAEAREQVERARRKDAAVAAAQKAANNPRTPSGPDLTFSRTPIQNAGYGSQSTVVISDGNASANGRQSFEEVSRHQQQQEEMRLREEEITRRRAEQRRQEQEGIARRQQEAEDLARMARMSLSDQPPSSGSSTSPMPMYSPQNQATTPTNSYYPTPPQTHIEYPSVHPSMRTPQPQDRQGNSYLHPYSNGPAMLPIESPSRYEGDSTDSESVHNYDHRRMANKHRVVDHKPPPRNIRSPVAYPPPVTTTSPPPDAGSIRYPSLMSQHQKTQGYYPSLGSMFADSMNPLHQPSSVLFGSTGMDNSRANGALYPTNVQPPPGGAYPYGSGPSTGSYGRPQPPIPNNMLPPPPPQPMPPTNADDRIIKIDSSDPFISSSSAASNSSLKSLKTVNLPRECLGRFLAIAKINTEMNRETCGLLLGKDKGHKYSVTTLLIPKQHSTSDSCTMDEEELVLQFTEERSLITLGWIHTHPTQSCFMSSVDLHTHSGFQRMLPESFAVVCAPKSNPNFGIFRLTDPPGLEAILGCTEKEAFHPHPDIPIYTDADKGHVQIKDSSLEIVDLR
ncbi:hypothetical protein CPB83DRAFT_849571 [Crepidotus variabilis]|uniref:MPN domain-containing protein n=1 Tax=Crepidotus variabilis TaxID=179855 RepID=A0A9P6JSS0_9AGAR|nr:hypothetical protein CPB83DRAFT_849571 [Crepidotus variabilis]